MRIWVWRRAGRPGGDPKGSYDQEIVARRIPGLRQRIADDRPEPLDYDSPDEGYHNPEDFFFRELFERDTLRQGWGVPGLSVTQERDYSYIPAYVFACWKYWNANVLDDLDMYCRLASGRYSILQRMNRINRGDVAFVPRTMQEGEHDRGFTIVDIAGDYLFEADRDRTHRRGSWLKDFAHCRRVARVRSYQYSPSALSEYHFQMYRAAICEVAHGHKYYDQFTRIAQE